MSLIVMRIRAFGLAVVTALASLALTGPPVEVGKPGLTAAPCPDQASQPTDPAFEPLPQARAFSGHYDGGVYRIERPDAWNGELVLWAHGYTPEGGAQGAQLRAGFPSGGANNPFRQHLIDKGFAWAASSYRCNGYVPGAGLLDTMALVDLFTKANDGKPPSRVYLTGGSMGGHVTLVGLQEFPKSFAGGLALCASGPGEMDFLASVGAAAELIASLPPPDGTSGPDRDRLTEVLGTPKAYTDKGRQLASIQIGISGGPRPFAVEGLASRFIENAAISFDGRNDKTIWGRVASNDDTRYDLEAGLGLTAGDVNARVRRRHGDAEARSARGPYEEAIPFDGRIERPLLTLHNTGDLYVPITLERTLKRAVDAAGRSSLLVQRIVRSAGHCGFSPQETIRSFDDLVAWVHGGSKPAGDDVMADFTNAGLAFTEPLRPNDPGTLRIAPAAR